MKPWVKILILVAALAVCVAGCFIVVDIVKDNDDIPEIDTDTVIVGGFENDIQSITSLCCAKSVAMDKPT